MRFYRPHSFFALLLTGFVFVSLPLFTALYSSNQILDDLVQQGTGAVFRSVDRVNSSRKIGDLLEDQERKARQLNVLGELAQLDAVNKAHREVNEVFEYILDGDTDEKLTELVQHLRAEEQYVVAVLNRSTGDPEQLKREQKQVVERYRGIDSLIKKIQLYSNDSILQEIETLKRRVDEDKGTLAWQTSGLIGFSILLVMIFVVLISRPVRQLDRGIERLGDGDFKTPVKVAGPKDLEALGEKLDWLRQRLAALDREKIKMVAHISHELKTPLASIKEGAGLLRDELVGPMNSSQKEVVGILDKNCSKLQQLIENILDFNMSQARRKPFTATPLALHEIIEQVAEDHRNAVLARNITLNVKLAPARVAGDKRQLRAIFDNLLSNAIKFTPGGGMIRIHSRVDGNTVTCIVEDNGPGIAEEDRSKIFSPFFQGKERKNGVVKGSGLGLAITREYVLNHDGKIRLLSGKQGARFAVTLPRMT